MAFQLSSPSFTHQHDIPARYTSDGEDVSPALMWTDPPTGTKSFALVVDDPDAPDPAHPKRTWVHWVVYNVPVDARSLPEGATNGAALGKNDWQVVGWRGPSPPIGRHRYFFKLYALDTLLGDLPAGASKADLESAMTGHLLGTATLVGRYEKHGS